MPSPEQILSGLSELANEWVWLAAAWHVYLAVVVVSLVVGLRPTRRVVGVLLAAPLLSVSALSWVSGNLFSGTFFAVVGIVTLGISRGLGSSRVGLAARQTLLPGVVMLVFGWVYPHFVETRSLWRYLYCAPVGVLPCPTLSVVIGIGLMLGGLGSDAWSLVVGLTGLFYGVFGAARLGVRLDWVLVVGALWLVVTAFVSRRVPRVASPGIS